MLRESRCTGISAGVTAVESPPWGLWSVQGQAERGAVEARRSKVAAVNNSDGRVQGLSYHCSQASLLSPRPIPGGSSQSRAGQSAWTQSPQPACGPGVMGGVPQLPIQLAAHVVPPTFLCTDSKPCQQIRLGRCLGEGYRVEAGWTHFMPNYMLLAAVAKHKSQAFVYNYSNYVPMRRSAQMTLEGKQCGSNEAGGWGWGREALGPCLNLPGSEGPGSFHTDDQGQGGQRHQQKF